ncbi:MAG: hypothetical protein PHC28_12390 [Flavobacterium sp.]|uniref:hypothetical protein n=1 Tax=Flavobacterium sp. TaxID=239 RepID=UPI00261BD0B4|nr:hypothetical protein [Flavobacterium sp.]MDD5151253.1 hypothetical protein [Flavobacterium sp.]
MTKELTEKISGSYERISDGIYKNVRNAFYVGVLSIGLVGCVPGPHHRDPSPSYIRPVYEVREPPRKSHPPIIYHSTPKIREGKKPYHPPAYHKPAPPHKPKQIPSAPPRFKPGKPKPSPSLPPKRPYPKK